MVDQLLQGFVRERHEGQVQLRLWIVSVVGKVHRNGGIARGGVAAVVLNGDVEQEAGRVGHRFFQGNQLLVIVPVGGVAAQGVHRVVVLQRPERRETQQGINRVAVVVGAIHQMQAGRLVTGRLKIAGQRENRLPDQVHIGGAACGQEGHGVAGECLKLRVGGSAPAGGNK